ncbi:MAG: AsmA family protein [Pseudomonadota bacterium]
MQKGKAALIVLVLAALLMAAAVVAWLLVDAEQIRNRLEAGLGDTLGMDVQIGAPLQFGLLPGPSITIKDLEVSKQGQVVATADSARAGFALSRLLTGKVQPSDLHLRQLELAVERSESGSLNIFESGSGPSDKLMLQRLRVTGARITYLDQATEREWLLEQCHLDLHEIRHGGGALAQLMGSLAAEGEVRCETLGRDRFRVSDVVVGVRGESGAFELEPVRATVLEGKLSGRVEADLSAASPELSLESTLSGFGFGAFMRMLNPDQVAAGKIDLELDLTAQGNTWQALRQSAAGNFTMNSGELTFKGYDLDEELEDYAETQRFNLVDVGAMFLAGPIGLAVTRGYEFTAFLDDSEGSTTIDQMVSEWTIDSGLAQARDVAFRTPQNRLALTGALDFGNVSFENLRVAVIDAEGCAVVEQQITGPFHDPEIDKPNVLVAVTGPMIDLVQRGVQAITDSDCETFYTGSMPHP